MKKRREIIIRTRKKLREPNLWSVDQHYSYLAMKFCELAVYMMWGEKQTLKQFFAGKIEKLLFPRNLAADPQQWHTAEKFTPRKHFRFAFSSISLDRVLSTRSLFRQTWKGNKGSPTGHNGHSCNWREEVARCAPSQEAARSDLRLRSCPPVVAAWNAAERREECRWAAEEFTLCVLGWTNQFFTVFL